MSNTRYVNPNGLPDNRQISSAHDIAILTRAILRDYPQYYSFFSQEQFTYRGKTYVNTNHLLGKMPGVDGLKTGFTNAAGFNLDASAMRNGHRLIAVVMGSSSGSVRNANVEGLLLTGFDIMDRRDHGERIASTQGMFGAPANVYAVQTRVPAGQGEGDEDPIGVVLTRVDTHPGPITVSESMAGATTRAVMAAPSAARDWWVQVGAFRSHQQAKTEIARVSHRFARILAGAEASVDGGGHAYRARFSGLTQVAAKEACSAVRSRGLSCAVGRPV